MNRAWAILVCAAILAVGRPAFADDARDLIEQGNEHYAASRYADALAAYENARKAAGQSPPAELLHNLAATHFRLGQLDQARDLWSRVRDRKDAAFEAKALYNLGNCHYAKALELSQSAPQRSPAEQTAAAEQAMAALEEAVTCYQEAIRLDSQQRDARANVELAHRLKQELKNRFIADCNENGEPDHREIEAGTAADCNENGIPDECDISGGVSEDQDQNGVPDECDQASQQQQGDPSQGDDQKQDKDQSENQDQPQNQGQNQDQSQEQGQSQDESGEQDQPEQSEQPQGEEEGEQQQAEPLEAESQPADRDEASKQPVTIQMTRAQAERLLQMVRDAERARREMLVRQQQRRQTKVERDW